jgi:hypothetical protein
VAAALGSEMVDLLTAGVLTLSMTGPQRLACLLPVRAQGR